MTRTDSQKRLVIYSTLNTENNSIRVLHVLHANLLDAITSVSRHASGYSLQSDIIQSVLTSNMSGQKVSQM